MINIAICDESRYYADELKNYIYGILGDNVFVSVHDNYFSLTTYIVDECKLMQCISIPASEKMME